MYSLIPRSSMIMATALKPSGCLPIIGRRLNPFQRDSFSHGFNVLVASQIRPYTQETNPRRVYTFQDVVSLLANPGPNRTLIDTREPHELQTTGTIPGSINIPISSKPDSFHITSEEFEDRFGFQRPGKEQEIVVYCKAGVRSRAAAELARQQGWVNVVEYEGSWLDWERNGGEKEEVR